MRKPHGRRSLWLILGVWVGGAAGLAVVAFSGCAAEPNPAPQDAGLATLIAGRDDLSKLERELGPSSCRVQVASDPTLTYLYELRAGDQLSYLQIGVTHRIDAIVWSKDKLFPQACYTPLQRAVPVSTARGIRLGMTLTTILRRYGQPILGSEEGALVRCRYLDSRYEWDLLFRNGYLEEWSLATLDE